MFTKKLEDQFSADLLNTVRGVLDEAKKCPEDCECEKCEKEDDEDEDEGENGKEMKEGKRGLWDNIHAKRKRIKAGSGERMRKPGSEGAPSNADLKAASEGYVPTADEPTEANKKVAQKIRDMMAKEKKPVKEESEELGEVSKATMGRYINKAKDSIDMASYRQGHREAHGGSSKSLEKKLTKRHKGIETAVKKLTKEDAEQIEEAAERQISRDEFHKAGGYQNRMQHTTGDEKNKKYWTRTPVREEAEQIDELSKATMGRYINKAATKMGSQGVTAGLKIAADEKSSKNFKDMGKREKGIKLAVSKLTKEEQDFIDSLNNDTLEEGRGRPPKEGSAAWHAKQKQASDDMVALGMQLRKAKSINKKVRFMDNKEHDIHPNHISRFEDHMAARRTTQEKDNFQRQAHKSHADFVKAVSAPVPKAAKDTGEIVKYR